MPPGEVPQKKIDNVKRLFGDMVRLRGEAPGNKEVEEEFRRRVDFLRYRTEYPWVVEILKEAPGDVATSALSAW
jgi:hypothetical protein